MSITDPTKFLTTKQAQDRLSISRSTAMRLIKERAFPGAFKVGSDWRIPDTDIDNYARKAAEYQHTPALAKAS